TVEWEMFDARAWSLDHADACAALDQFVDEMTADEAGAAGDDDGSVHGGVVSGQAVRASFPVAQVSHHVRCVSVRPGDDLASYKLAATKSQPTVSTLPLSFGPRPRRKGTAFSAHCFAFG